VGIHDFFAFLLDKGYLLAAAFLGMFLLCHKERTDDKAVHRKLYEEVLERFKVVSDVLIILKERADHHPPGRRE